MIRCEHCFKILRGCDAIFFPMPLGLPYLYFHEDCFEEWIEEGKEFTEFDEYGKEID